jgi:hypothetical protein
MKESNHQQDTGIDERRIMKWIFSRMEVSELDLPGSGQGEVVGSYEHSNEPIASTEMGIT